ncbi:MAG: ATP-grasp ribosomal peptide maturase, partial [Sciscionella sp.]
VHGGSAAAYTDWRADYPSLSYELVDTPGHIAGSVAAYLEHFGLTFACFDFTVDHSGQWWFLEAGANAQWGWLEHETGLPIADAIACQLIGESA